MRETTTRFLTLALAAALSACASSGHRYQDKTMDFGSLKTVAVMPFQNLSRDNLAGDRVRDVFANALLATEAVYVVPNGEVARALGKVGVPNATAPSAEEVVKLGQAHEGRGDPHRDREGVRRGPLRLAPSGTPSR